MMLSREKATNEREMIISLGRRLDHREKVEGKFSFPFLSFPSKIDLFESGKNIIPSLAKYAYLMP